MSQNLRPIHNPDELEVAPGVQRENLEGWVPQFASDEDVRQALDKAFDYRGDVTLTLKDGRKISGYVFDRREGKNLRDSLVRLFPASSDERLSIAYAEIAARTFSGRDTASVLSW